MIALAVCEIGSLSERRMRHAGRSGAVRACPAFLTAEARASNSGFMIPQVTAAALVSENKQRAYPASVDSIPTSANQEDHVSMAAHWRARLLAMAENAPASSAIELLAAAQGCDFHAPLAASDADRARARAPRRVQVPHLDEDRYLPSRSSPPPTLIASAPVACSGQSPRATPYPVPSGDA